MGFFQAIVLGVVQGLTEFLPVSSDGHLALTYRLFHQSPDLTFEVFLHLATLVAMVVYFRADILTLVRAVGPAGKGSPERRLVGLIAVATAISAVLALVMKKAVVAANESLLRIRRVSTTSMTLNENFSEEDRRLAIEKWKTWYQSIRPSGEVR